MNWLGHSRTLICLFLSHSFVALAVCFGSLSCWKTHPWPIVSALTAGRRLSPKISRYMAPFILPLIRWSHPVPLAEKHPQSIRFPPPCFTVGMVFLGLYSAFLFLQTRRVELMPNSSSFVSSDHITFSQASSGSSRCSLANFRRASTCAFFSRGTLRSQQPLLAQLMASETSSDQRVKLDFTVVLSSCISPVLFKERHRATLWGPRLCPGFALQGKSLLYYSLKMIQYVT